MFAEWISKIYVRVLLVRLSRSEVTLILALTVCLSTVRQKVKELITLIQDDDALRNERKKAKKNKDKYIGMSGGLSGQYYR